MTLAGIFNLLNYIGGKELTGNAFTLDQYNLLLEHCTVEIKGEEYDKIFALTVQEQPKGLSEFLTTSMLRPFVKEKSLPVDIDHGQTDVPEDYEKWISGFKIYKGNFRNVELVGNDLFNIRSSSIAYRADVHPFGRMVNNLFYFVPYDLSDIEVTYVRKSGIPFLDFCQDSATMEEVLMPKGSQISVAGVLIDGSGTVSNSSVFKSGATLPYTSLTVELEFEQWTHYKFISRILSKLSIPIGEDKITEYAMALEKQGK